ncbi:2'-5' RNA ligase [Motilibacter peucedani]|uniref:RNA 2',3'-cyclic phosphodiesterase n=1 Tax=Motilibacter peucedani TaxID=598650 RepID=A0A420XNB7_9ACTN|nr:RNA 2',3'-cyclic phosphodiesterase [Motilibacter peucedani]RKS72780.1 2'-5' RNA ligase [Motilibacter peucedani]
MTDDPPTRVFVALWPSAEAAAHLQAALDALDAPLRWVPAERRHITLAFVGDVDGEGVAKVVQHTQQAVRSSAPLHLQLAGAGRFGSSVLWAGVAGDTEPLAALARAIGWQDEQLRSHLTLARGRGKPDLRPWAQRLADYAGPEWTAQDVTVVRSLLGPSPRYEVLERIALTTP